ncbi:MAG: ATP-binding cassette domain-containing protein, partial [Sphaerochaeta sp.]
GVQDRKKSKRNIAVKDHDAKARIDGARISGADGKAGRLKAQIETRAEHLNASLQKMQGNLVEANMLDLGKPVSGITIESNPLKRDLVARITPGRLPLGPERTLLLNSLEIGPMDRIAITGRNGSGKSTFMQYLHSLIASQGIPLAYVPQEQERSACFQALEDLEAMDPTTKGRVLSSLTRLGSDPDLIRSSVLASPGEAKKLLLSLLFEEPVSVLLLDEPTNHLDLPSRLALEKALGAWNGAIVCVSHDVAFLDAVCTIQWHIDKELGLTKKNC